MSGAPGTRKGARIFFASHRCHFTFSQFFRFICPQRQCELQLARSERWCQLLWPLPGASRGVIARVATPFILERANPLERRGRKAVGLPPRGQGRQVAEGMDSEVSVHPRASFPENSSGCSPRPGDCTRYSYAPACPALFPRWFWKALASFPGPELVECRAKVRPLRCKSSFWLRYLKKDKSQK
jgi:hypothetical protein